MLRAVAYQVRQSLLAWIGLGPDEILYLEGAEDFDVVGLHDAEAVQVHDSTRRVSLRTPKVQEAIANYWRLDNEHTGVPVRLRFLSRARPTVEQGEPFGVGVAGLELWQRRHLDDSEVRLLTDFLVTQPELPESLKTFLKSAPPDQIRKNFLGHIAWDLGSPDASALDLVIQEKLALLGEPFGLPYSEAAKTRHRFFLEIFETAGQRQSSRAMTRAKFLELFEKEALVQVPRSELAALRRQTVERERFQIDLIQGRLDLLTAAPPLPESIEERANLVVQLHQHLETHGQLILIGSAGMGKTTLAKLVASVDPPEDWHWARLTNQKPDETARTLRGINILLDRDPTIRSLVLDDLDLRPESVGSFEDALIGLICRLRQTQGRLLISGQKEPLPKHNAIR